MSVTKETKVLSPSFSEKDMGVPVALFWHLSSFPLSAGFRFHSRKWRIFSILIPPPAGKSGT